MYSPKREKRSWTHKRALPIIVMFYSVCLWKCTCMYIFVVCIGVHRCACPCVHMHVEARGQYKVSFLITSHPNFETESLTKSGAQLVNSSRWPASKPQGSSSPGITEASLHIQFGGGDAGNQTRVLMLAGHFSTWLIFLIPGMFS